MAYLGPGSYDPATGRGRSKTRTSLLIDPYAKAVEGPSTGRGETRSVRAER